MQVSDLGNAAIAEANTAVLIGRFQGEELTGDLIEMLLGFSFMTKEGMLDWSWMGVDPKEWPSQRLDWELYRVEHLTYVSSMESSMARWLTYLWIAGYTALRTMARGEWAVPHNCQFCGIKGNAQGSVDPFDYFEATLKHVVTTNKCYGGMFAENSLDVSGSCLVPSVLELLQIDDPEITPRDVLPAATVLYLGPGSRRQWLTGIKAMWEAFSQLTHNTRLKAFQVLKGRPEDTPKWSQWVSMANKRLSL